MEKQQGHAARTCIMRTGAFFCRARRFRFFLAHFPLRSRALFFLRARKCESAKKERTPTSDDIVQMITFLSWKFHAFVQYDNAKNMPSFVQWYHVSLCRNGIELYHWSDAETGLLFSRWCPFKFQKNNLAVKQLITFEPSFDLCQLLLNNTFNVLYMRCDCGSPCPMCYNWESSDLLGSLRLDLIPLQRQVKAVDFPDAADENIPAPPFRDWLLNSITFVI